MKTPKLLSPRDIALSIAAIPESAELARPLMTWGPGFVRCTWSRDGKRRQLVVTVTLDPAGRVRYCEVARVGPDGTAGHICIRNPVRYVRDGVDWFLGDDRALRAPATEGGVP